jgi:hypothetical protein
MNPIAGAMDQNPILPAFVTPFFSEISTVIAARKSIVSATGRYSPAIDRPEP